MHFYNSSALDNFKCVQKKIVVLKTNLNKKVRFIRKSYVKTMLFRHRR